MRRERCTRLRAILYPPLAGWANFWSRPDQGVGTHKPRLRRFFGVAGVATARNVEFQN
jgi:hypothetical protein